MSLIGARFWSSLVGLCCLVASFACAAQPAAEDDLYQEAVQLLEKGDRQGAIERYNRLLENLPNHAGAWLDLALLYCEQGDVVHTQQIFDLIEKQFAPPPAILEIIRHYRSNGCMLIPAPAARWIFGIGSGHTDNVNHGLSNPIIDLSLPVGVTSVQLGDAYLPHSSAIATVSASYIRNLKTLPGTQWFVGIAQKTFPGLHELNQRSILTGVVQQHVFGNWLQEFELAATHFSLNEHPHQTGLLAQAGLWLPVAGERLPRLGIEVAASRWRYTHDPLYDSTVIEAHLGARWTPTERIALRGAVGPLADNASRERPGLDRHGYLVNLSGQWALSDRARVDVDYRQRLLQDEAVYSPLFGERRHRSMQRQLLLAIQFKKNPSTPYTWRLEWERSQSRDNIPLFPYTSHTLTLGWQYQWDGF